MLVLQVTFSALFTTLISLLLPPSLGEPCIAKAMHAFGIPQQGADFITGIYYPEVSLPAIDK